ncbi:MAG: hypothetical protein ACIALR_13560, partial [Blastopirellula sp. JB062]
MSLQPFASLWRRMSGSPAHTKRRRTISLRPQVDFLERRQVMDGDPAATLFPAPIADPDNPFAVDAAPGVQDFGFNGDAVALSEGGAYVVAWIDSGTPGSNSVYVQRYQGTQAGDPLDPARTDADVADGPRILLTTTANQVRSVQVVANASGQFVVGWREIDGTQSPFRMQRFEADGTPVGGTIVVGYQQANEPTFAINDSGQIVVVWGQSGVMSGVAYNDFYFDETTETGSTFAVQSTQTGAVGHEVALDNNGRFIVAWSTSSTTQIRYRRFDITESGVNAVDVNEVTITNPDEYSIRYDTPDVAVNDAGEVVIVYQRRIPSSGRNAFRTAYNNDEEIVAQYFTGFGSAELVADSRAAAVTPTLPSFANEIMVTGPDSNGENGAQRFPRVDIDSDGNFVVGYQELLDSPTEVTYYLVQYAKQFDELGAWIGFQKASSDVVGTSGLYNGSSAVDMSVVMNSRGDIVTLFTSGVETVSGDEVDVFARRFGFQSPPVVNPPGGDPPSVIFTPEEVIGYGGGEQDQTPDGLAISNDGATLTLTGNTWKQVLGSFVITEHTILEFDFDLISEGEIHAIGFDVDDDFAPDTMFRIAGTQNWGIDVTALRVEGTNTVRIPVGQFYTSTPENPFTRIVLVNDDDEDASAESSFSNIRLYEEVPSTTVNIGGEEVTADVSTYGGDQDHAINQVTIDSETNSITVEGNAWKKIDLPEDIVISANTILQFEFDAETLGEIHAIGFANDPLNIAPGQTFRVAGTQNWGINATDLDQLLVDHDDDPLTADVFQIPVGQYFTGSFDYLTIVNDDDVSADVKATFSNIKIFDADHTPTITINGVAGDVDLISFGGGQDQAPSVVGIDGDTIRIEGNGWKALALDGGVEITSTTVLTFTFESDSIGEIHGIGFATDATLGTADPQHSFRTAGSQNWGLNATNDSSPYISIVGNTWTIEVGKFFTGN